MGKPEDDDLKGDFAFPWVTHERFCTGMTLRDWFAGQAVAALAARGMPNSFGDRLEDWMASLAAASFNVADHMLTERAKGGEA